MDQNRIKENLAGIESSNDLLEKSLRLAGLVTALFEERGIQLVVVGGSAIEFYTEGAYMSGDIDLCRLSSDPIGLRLKQELMGTIGGIGGPRSWEVQNLFVDILGELETEARTPLRDMTTPQGTIRLVQPEMILVERVLTAVYPRPNAAERACALKLLTAFLDNKVPVDWSEIQWLAARPEYQVIVELEEMKKEASDALGTT